MRHINVTRASTGLHARVAVRMTVTAVACCLVACGGAGSTGGEPGSSTISTTTTSAALASSGAPRRSPGHVRSLRRAGDAARGDKYGYSSFEVCSAGALCASAPTTEYYAEFYGAAGDSGGCTVSSHGACTALSCPASSGGGGQLYSAGTLSISSGIGDVEVTTDKKEGLVYEWSQPGAAFAPGEGLSVSGSGAQVPAFGAQLITAPPQLDLVAPLPDRRGRYRISTTSPLDVAWSNGTAGGVTDFTAYASFSDSFAYVECDWDAAQGAGAIPAEDLTSLAGGSDAFITWGQIDTAEFAAGGFTVYNEAQIYGAALATFE